ncbi:hypothetical protein NPIL_156031 [Nephila pilipes]|uniref:Uncharacterized protein n=1 Tax=Nephila pilipes TaxID=299642 RepID=A0A8X6UVU7_NEPPI|nr:hypothetical protein NPIL_156031 [Nephila pilipes]
MHESNLISTRWFPLIKSEAAVCCLITDRWVVYDKACCKDAVKFNRGIPWDERLVRSSAKGCRPAQCRLRSQPRKNPSLATVRGERKFVRQHKKEPSRRSSIWIVVCGQVCMTRHNDALRSRFPDLFELSSTFRDSEAAEQEG